ncbi:nuclear transport factor 2 family protein [Comamonas sp. NLF-1-9]|uniref:nuclear transport factor 2 family protein n=1 Tax=Comamonas sp. NLF-1-9 TaxID=2853163 RepID=UPI001C43C975|nr:nuclear transport factor 2 family protein [Comamonas sp. NLF-1-9]QXL83279.1 tetratricopeptide repeat protein [Comamonas sp. NLF-1-9]
MLPLRHPLARLLQLSAALLLCTAAVHASDYADIAALLKDGKASQALVQVEQRLAATPKDPQLRFLRGVAQSESRQTKAAIETFTELTRDYPELPEPYNNLAVLYAQENQLDKARAALEMAIRTNPSYATAHENLGDIYAKLAGQAYNKALQLEGASGESLKPKLALIRDLFPARSTPSADTAPAPEPGAPAKAAAAQPPAAASASSTQAPASATAQAQAQASAAAPASGADTGAAAAASQAEQSVAQAVQAWARAWSDKDMQAYLSAYADDFSPAGRQSRAAWEKDRHARIVGKSQISVKLHDLKIKVRGDEASASFRQEYQGDALHVNSSKTLTLARRDGNWKITRESVGR